MELESWNFDNTNFKTIQFDTLDETNLKGIIWSPNYRLLFWEANLEKKLKNLIFVWKHQNWEIYYRLSVYLFMDMMSFNYIDLKWPLSPKNINFVKNFHQILAFSWYFLKKTTCNLKIKWYFLNWSQLLYQIVYFWSLQIQNFSSLAP